MDITLQGRNFRVDDRLADLVDKKIAKAAKFFNGISEARVEIMEETNPRVAEKYRVEITSRAAGSTVRVEAAGSTPEEALDAASDTFTLQLRKVKERLIDRTRRPSEKHLNGGAPPAETEIEESPRIVRVKQFVMKPMTPEEAALQMDLLGHGFFFFQNAETDLPSVLYRRRDGAYGLIEPA